MSRFPLSFLFQTIFDIVDCDGARLGHDRVWMLQKRLYQGLVINHLTDGDEAFMFDNGSLTFVLATSHEVRYRNVENFLHLGKHKCHLVLQKRTAFLVILR